MSRLVRRRQTVLVLSPYAGDVEGNLEYAKSCMQDSLSRGEAPFAPHLLYTQEGVLSDDIPEERDRGIDCSIEWGWRAQLIAAYIDHGISDGMQREMLQFAQEGRTVLLRSVYGDVTAEQAGTLNREAHGDDDEMG